MYGSMQKPHDCGLLCNLSRPVFARGSALHGGQAVVTDRERSMLMLKMKP
jgi:hypothetical protein